MRWIVVVPLVVHGLIHLMGFAKAFGHAELPQLTRPISREMGVVPDGRYHVRVYQQFNEPGLSVIQGETRSKAR